MNRPQIFKKKPSGFNNAIVQDLYFKSLRELYYVRNPEVKKRNNDQSIINDFIKKNNFKSSWVYLPWKNLLIKFVDENVYFELRTARNRQIINNEEQKKFHESKIGIIGLSVGSSAALSLVVGGGPRSMRLSDYDFIEITNLNRMKAKLYDVGENKSVVMAKNIWEVDPYADLDIWPQGVSKDSIEDFLIKPEPLNLFIDAMDSLELKFVSRLYCKKHKLPVLMATDNGNGVILDVERYDIDKDIYPFNGIFGKVNFDNYDKLLADDWLDISKKIVGDNLLSKRMYESVEQFRKNLSGIPQLGLASDMAGSILTFVAGQILNNYKVESGRYFFSLDDFAKFKI
jgi:molybdopterin/thiamine biosynthesis adenylyltransferase